MPLAVFGFVFLFPQIGGSSKIQLSIIYLFCILLLFGPFGFCLTLFVLGDKVWLTVFLCGSVVTAFEISNVLD